MNNQVLIDNLRSIPDFPQKGINFRDVTTLYKSAECMQIMVDELGGRIVRVIQRQRNHQNCRN